MDTETLPDTLQEAIQYFADSEHCRTFFSEMRWADGVVICPRCGSKEVGKFSGKRMVSNCKSCKKQFTIKIGTIFEDSALGLEKWLPAIWMIVNAKNGVSSYELHRGLGVTQKTAWFMLHRIRLALQNGSFMKMNGTVEVDETFIGGKARNMHAAVKRAKNIKTGGMSMTPVMGLLERGTRERCSRVKTTMIKTRKAPELQANVRQYVLKGSEVHTDSLRSYNGLCDEYTHNVIDHAKEYVRGHVHTNGMENFWSLLKRSIKGTYVNVEPFHLFRYLDEQAFRFNERKNEDGDKGRFLEAVKGVIGRGLKYVDLIGKGGDDLRQTAAW